MKKMIKDQRRNNPYSISCNNNSITNINRNSSKFNCRRKRGSK